MTDKREGLDRTNATPYDSPIYVYVDIYERGRNICVEYKNKINNDDTLYTLIQLMYLDDLINAQQASKWYGIYDVDGYELDQRRKINEVGYTHYYLINNLNKKNDLAEHKRQFDLRQKDKLKLQVIQETPEEELEEMIKRRDMLDDYKRGKLPLIYMEKLGKKQMGTTPLPTRWFKEKPERVPWQLPDFIKKHGKDYK